MFANPASPGNYWNSSIQSTIVSHVLNEAATFTPSWVNSSDTFTAFLNMFLPGDKLAPQRQRIAAQYPCTAPPYNGNYSVCIATVIRDSSFTCNTRDLYSAYPDVAHMMQYGFPWADLAVHAADLIALFANSYEEAMDILDNKDGADLYADMLINSNLSLAYQTYFASFALSGGDPNALEMPRVEDWDPPKWPVADGSSGDELRKVLTVRTPFNLTTLSYQPAFVLNQTDGMNSKKACSFWTEIAEEVVATQEATDVVKNGESWVYPDEL